MLRNSGPIAVADPQDFRQSAMPVSHRERVQHFEDWQYVHGRNLTNAKSIRDAIDYLHANPVRRGLCQLAIEWKSSSARRLIEDATLDGTPRLTRLEPELMTLDSPTPTRNEEHC
jgi:hypothetical protein